MRRWSRILRDMQACACQCVGISSIIPSLTRPFTKLLSTPVQPSFHLSFLIKGEEEAEKKIHSTLVPTLSFETQRVLYVYLTLS